MRAISFDISGEMAFFKKNDANDIYMLSYNYIHKPAVLGILGAILGLKGYKRQKEQPEFYITLKDFKIAIVPHYMQPLKKMMSIFNNATGFANEDGQGGAVWQVREQILVGEPTITYTIIILENQLTDYEKLKTNLTEGKSVYPLYFGKNEFFAYYHNFCEYNACELTEEETHLHSLFIKGDSENEEENPISIKDFSFDDFDPLSLNENNGITVTGRLPVDFDENGFYRKELMAISELKLKIRNNNGLYRLEETTNEEGRNINVQFL